MRKHNGMRPQDVVVLLKIAALATADWQGKDLAAALYISPAEISDALRRCQYARLLHENSRTVQRQALLRFLVHGLPYVFPARPGAYVRGMPTAHSALSALQSGSAGAEPPYVWPTADGEVWGAAIEPLYAGAPMAASQDELLHELLSLADALRAGQPAQRKLAKELITARLLVQEQA